MTYYGYPEDSPMTGPMSFAPVESRAVTVSPVRGASSLCSQYGCQLKLANDTLQEMNRVLQERANMTTARWCDYRNHAYRAPDDPDEINIMKLGGASKEICYECAVELGLTNEYTAPEPPLNRKAAIENAVKGK